MATIAPTAPAHTAFPAAAIEACLRDELVETIKSLAGPKGIALPSTAAQIAAHPVQIDSLVCVDILCAVDSIVGFEVPERVVRSGGYNSIDAAINHLIPRIHVEWNKKKGVTP